MKPHQSPDYDPTTKDKPLVPKPGTDAKLPGMTRKGFGQLIKRAFTQAAPKSHPKSTS
jgi:hypothetical protein